jgi:hypothetical protein
MDVRKGPRDWNEPHIPTKCCFIKTPGCSGRIAALSSHLWRIEFASETGKLSGEAIAFTIIDNEENICDEL